MALTLAGALLAQPPAGSFRRGASGTPPNPQQIVQREVTRLTHLLDLSTDQQTKVSGILSADINNLTSLQSTLKTQRGAVLDAVKTNSGVSSAVAAASGTESQIAAIRANEAALIYATLTADQKAKVGDSLTMLSGGVYGPGPGRSFGPRR